jgi:hypothetical protein
MGGSARRRLLEIRIISTFSLLRALPNSASPALRVSPCFAVAGQLPFVGAPRGGNHLLGVERLQIIAPAAALFRTRRAFLTPVRSVILHLPESTQIGNSTLATSFRYAAAGAAPRKKVGSNLVPTGFPRAMYRPHPLLISPLLLDRRSVSVLGRSHLQNMGTSRHRAARRQVFHRSETGLSAAFVNLRPIVPGHVLVVSSANVPRISDLDVPHPPAPSPERPACLAAPHPQHPWQYFWHLGNHRARSRRLRRVQIFGSQ